MASALVGGIAMALAAWPTGAGAAYVLSRTFDDPTVTGNDFFGLDVAIGGDTVVIGASADGTLGALVGQVHLFDAGSGALLRTIDDPTVTSADRFGIAVDIDGGNLLVGAMGDDTAGTDIGQAHLFDATSGALLHTFDDPTPTVSDWFGRSVALDGNSVLIGANQDDSAGTDVGQAHLFDASSGALLRTFDDPTVTDADEFGNAVAISGNSVLIGAPRDDTFGIDVGQAHLFDASTGALLRTFDDPTVTGDDRFGYAVAIDGDKVLIGAPGDNTNGTFVGQVHLFDAVTGALLMTFDDPTVTSTDEFGYAVAIDGNLVLIGARLDDSGGNNVGQAYLFDAVTGMLLQVFDDPTVTFGDQFGARLDIDGKTVLIGAYLDSTLGFRVGQAHLFTAIAEPSALALLLAGLAGLLLAARRRA